MFEKLSDLISSKNKIKRNNRNGWQCPICKHVYSPIMPLCPYCPRKVNVYFQKDRAFTVINEFKFYIDNKRK